MPPSEPTAGDAWSARLAELRTGAHPRGTLGHVDEAARRRGASAVRTGDCVSLARPLTTAAGDEPPKFQLTAEFERQDRLLVGFDRIEVTQHGVDHTHLDAWNHYGLDGSFFPGVDAASPEDASVAPWAAAGVVTRGVLLDVTAVRGTAWVQPDRPVTTADLDAALARSGGELSPGDAALVYMGRDRFEAAGNRYPTRPEAVGSGSPRPGMGVDAAEWIARRRVSVVCWDFLDAVSDTEPPGGVHLLIWAIGLGLVDNCDLGPARDALTASDRHDGLLVLSPLRMPGATASLVNPLLVY